MQDGSFGFTGARAEPQEPTYVDPPAYLQDRIAEEETAYVEELQTSTNVSALGQVWDNMKRNVRDVAMVGRGVAKAAGNTVELLGRAAAPAIKPLAEATPGLEASQNFLTWYNVKDEVGLDPFSDAGLNKVFGEPEGMRDGAFQLLGQIGSAVVGASGVVKVGTTAIGATQGGALAQAVSQGSKIVEFVKGSTIGAIADMSAFDGNEGRLMDFAAEYLPAGAQNVVTEYLQTDMDDGFFEGRFKNAIEGFGIGTGLVAGFMLSAKVIKGVSQLARAARGGNREAVEQATEKIARDVAGAKAPEPQPARFHAEANPDGSADVVIRDGTEAQGDFSGDAREFLDDPIAVQNYDMRLLETGDEPKLYHVSTDVESVRAQGLRSREELKVAGLSGGPSKPVSVTHSAERAQKIEETMHLAARAARDEVEIDEILDFFDAEGMFADGLATAKVAQRLGAPREAGESVEALEEWITSYFEKGLPAEEKSLFQLVKDLDTVRDDLVADQGALESVGFAGSRADMAKVDPAKIGQVEVEARRGSAVESVMPEDELRFDPSDVRVLTEDGPVTRAPQRIRFNTPEEAIGVAKKLAEMEEVAARGPGFTPEQAEAWAETTAEINAAFKEGDNARILAAIESSPINIRYVHNNNQAKSAILSMGEKVDLGSAPVPNSTTRKLADGLIPGMTVDEVIEHATAFFGTTEGLARNLVALRGYVTGLARQAARLSEVALASEGPVRAMNMAELGAKLDEMAELTEAVAGSSSNVARALQSQKMAVGPRKFADELAPTQAALDNVENARAVAERAREAGDAEAIAAADKQLQKAMKEAEELIHRETEGGIEGARRGDEVSATQLPPRAPGEAAEGAAEGAARELTTAERAEELAKFMRETIEQETKRADEVLAQESLTTPFSPDPSRVVFSEMTHDEIEALATMVFRSGNDPAKVLAQIAVPSHRAIARSRQAFLHDPTITGWAKAIRTAQWLRLNGLLSGPASLARDMLSTSLVSFQRPVEDAIGSLLTAAATGGRKASMADVRESVDVFAALFQNYGEAWQLAKQAFMDGDAIVDAGRHLARHDMGSMQELWQMGLVGKMEAVFGIPTRSRMAVDEFSKNVNYRAYLRAELLREGRALGRTGDALTDFVETRIRYGYGQQGDATMKRAIERAREPSFQQTLGTKGQKFEDAVQQSEIAKFIIPFRRTPLNIVNHVWERFPVLNATNGRMRADLLGKNGERAMREAVGKAAYGTMVTTTGTMLAFAGKITGGGPREPGKRQDTWRTANRPYTIRIGDTEINYNRLDPILTPFALMSDMVQISGELDDETYTEVAAMITASVAATMSNKAVFSGVAEFLEAMTQNDEAKLRRFLRRSAASFVPTLSAQLNPDDVFRESRTWMDEFLKRTPWSENVEARRNIFGAEVTRPAGVLNRGFNPLTLGSADNIDRKLAMELMEIGAYVSMPAPTMSFGDGDNAISVDLRQRGKWENVAEGRRANQSPYDRWMELYASTELGGRTLREKLMRTMETDSWKSLPTPARGQVVQGLISAYRKVTEQKMLQEYPSLRNQIIFARTMAKTKSATNDPETLQNIRDNFGVDERGAWTRLRNSVSGANRAFEDRNRRAAGNLLPENVGGNR